MSIPENPCYVGGYAAVAHAYIDRGWTPPLPLPHAQKSPPPAGFTGGGAQIPTPDQVEIWRREKANGNPALYLAEYDGFALLGVDIDNYAKGDRPAGRALEVIAEVEQRAGCTFAPTYVLRNRTDGSEKRIYRVPCGLLWRSNLGPGVELIHHHHRYVNAGINPGTGNPELWYDHEGQLTLQPPRPQDFAELPADLVDELKRGDGEALPAKATAEEAEQLLDNLPDGAMSESVRGLLDRAQRDLGGLNGSRHDVTLRHVRDLVRYGAAGLIGTATALSVLKDEFVDAVWQDPDHRGTREIAADEFDRMVTDGARRVAAMPEGELAGWSKALAAMEPGGLWHPNTLMQDQEEAFWTSCPELSDMRQFARSRRVGPWAMFGVCVAVAISAVPPYVVLPPLVGRVASLNTFVALVGKSGSIKSAAMGAALDWLGVDPPPNPKKPGSGEGLAKCFAYVKKPKGEPPIQVGKNWSVLAEIPEVDTLTATGGRGGSTLMSELRYGWSGERLGIDYAADDKAITLQAQRYRLCMVVGVQPLRAAPIFEDADAGTPQRFVWFPVSDPNRPKERPPQPARLDLPAWLAPRTDDHSGDEGSEGVVRFDPNVMLASRMNEPADPDEFEVLAVPDAVYTTIDDQAFAVLGDQDDIDPLDGHKLLCREKLAAAIAILRQHKEITEHDWDLAGTAMQVSDRTRGEVLTALATEAGERNRKAGHASGIRKVAEAERIAVERAKKVTRIAEKIVEKLQSKNDQTLNEIKKQFSGPDKQYVDEALGDLEDDGRINKQPFVYRGNEGLRIHLNDADAS